MRSVYPSQVDRWLVSPPDRLAFLRAVAEVSPRHRYQADRLIIDDGAGDGS